MRQVSLPLVSVLFIASLADAQSTTRVSVASDGMQGIGNSSPFIRPSMSADGRFVAFQSWATNLVPGDTNGVFDIFVHDRQAGVTTRKNIPAGGGQANNASFDPWLSADGRYAAFYSFANNLVAGDTNSKQDVFVRDRLLGVTTRESASTRGAQANGDSDSVVISGDGRFLAFPSQASNLVEGDTNGAFDVFVRDLGHALVGDLNGDGQVNGADLGMLLAQWGPCAGCSADLNGDGVVNGVDLGALLANWT